MYALQSMLSTVSQTVAAQVFLICTTLVVRLVRWHMDTFWSWYQEKKWLPNEKNYSQDGRSVMEGVKDITLVQYGALPRETCHVLTPTKSRGKDHVLVYIHGGGFVVANSTVLLHSVTLFCRHGYTVYSIDYPHAPEDRFPRPLVSVLQALRWLKAERGIDSVHLFGDSAGANLSTMAAALICNPKLLERFAKEACPLAPTWDFPSVTCQISLYGLLDQLSWRQNYLLTIGRTENAIALAGLRACMALYRSSNGVFENRITIADIAEDIHVFPRTLFIGASKDLLVTSSVAAHDMLRRRGFDVHIKMYDARHGFFGFPPSWTFGAWKTSAKPAARLMVSFLDQARRVGGCVVGEKEDRCCPPVQAQLCERVA